MTDGGSAWDGRYVALLTYRRNGGASRSDLRALTGLHVTLARCIQVGLLWRDPPVGADVAVLVVATLVWPANVAVLLTVLTRWSQAPRGR